ncbi:tropomodulin isoform X3, putative [Babesia ovata]|uniref:Tropomodulin isoform X3, putative n=1 Tax=Babesia ovata TaxID=189622 RepID=A0A2H6KFG7_9APIC|nr:tropomodulin isoform X3, putative [Babesia ovata]GBE61743.1 tropomodulin isoform X3, putative [Babesia ovata]
MGNSGTVARHFKSDCGVTFLLTWIPPSTLNRNSHESLNSCSASLSDDFNPALASTKAPEIMALTAALTSNPDLEKESTASEGAVRNRVILPPENQIT